MLNKNNIIFGSNRKRTIPAMKKLIPLFLLFVFCKPANAQEVIYEINTPDFFDSDGDGYGDLNGVSQKLDYLLQFGVTSIMLSPIYQSYNGYTNSFEEVDKTQGTWGDYKSLLKAVHLRRMKLYQDVSLEYISRKHEWFTKAVDNPQSKYADYIYYNKEKQTKEQLDSNVTDNQSKAVAVNLNNAEVLAYFIKILSKLADMDGDGTFKDGVDGFRILETAHDTTAPEIKNKSKETFWKPLIANLKKVNPEGIVFVSQNKNTPASEWLITANADRIYANGINKAIATLDKEKIITAADSAFTNTPENKKQVVFFKEQAANENEIVSINNISERKVAAALNILLGGVPSIYYGQETGDSWQTPRNKQNEQMVSEGQVQNNNSLWNFYKQLVNLRRRQPAVGLGSFKNVDNSAKGVISFIRQRDNDKVLVVINLSDTEQPVTITDNSLHLNKLQLLMGSANYNFRRGGRTIIVPPYWVQVWKVL